MTNKQYIRKHISKERMALSPEMVSSYSSQIWHKIYNMPHFQNASTIFIYSNIGKEVDTKEIASFALENHKKVAYPRTNTDTYTMEFYYVDTLSDLIPVKSGRFTLLEPLDNLDKKAIPDSKTLIIVPGLAFDKNMYRIGYGGGFYDKYLNKYPTSTTIGVCYDFQIVSDVFPEEHDESLRHIVTPTRHIVSLNS